MKFRKFHMPIKIGIRRKIEIILNATEFLTNFCSTKITENESIFENSEILKSSVKFHEWISISGTKFWMEHFKLISSTKFQSFFSLNSLKFSEIYVDSACLFIFMCKQTLIYGIQNFIFVTADIIYLIFVKSSSEKLTFLAKISQNSKVDIKGTLASNFWIQQKSSKS